MWPHSDGQYRAMAAALQLKCAQMRAGIERDELADSALIWLGAADPQAGIAAELRRQAELRVELEKALAFNAHSQAERVHSTTRSTFGSTFGSRVDMTEIIAKSLDDAFVRGCTVGAEGIHHHGEAYPEVTVNGSTDQNPPSEQWGVYGWPVPGRFWT